MGQGIIRIGGQRAVDVKTTTPRARRIAARVRRAMPSVEPDVWLRSERFTVALQDALREEDDDQVILSGRISEVSVAHLLQFAESIAGGAVCSFERGREDIEITVRDRHVVSACRAGALANREDQVETMVCEALGWKHGRFHVRKIEAHPTQSAGSLLIPLAGIILEGVRRQDEWNDRSDRPSSHSGPREALTSR